WITQTFHCSHWAIHPIDTSPVEPSLVSVMPCVLGVPAVERNAHDITKNRSNESIGPIRSEKASMAAIMEQHEHADEAGRQQRDQRPLPYGMAAVIQQREPQDKQTADHRYLPPCDAIIGLRKWVC